METTPTRLRYLEDGSAREGSATVVGSGSDETGPYVVLDGTIFHPQGGGQPSDTGTIAGGGAPLAVRLVLSHDGEVRHYVDAGAEALPAAGAAVTVAIDSERRQLLARLHTAGHLLAAIVESLYPQAKACKAYHFPDGPYVEFEGDFTGIDRDRALLMINGKLISAVVAGGAVTASGDAERRVSIAGYGAVACGGTHVSDLAELGRVNAIKMKAKGPRTRISYKVV